MPSLLGLLLREELRRVKPIISKFSVHASRKAQDGAGSLLKKTLSSKVSYTNIPFPAFEASMAHCGSDTCDLPKDENRAILYLHGGSYMVGSLGYSQGFGGVLARYTGQSTLCVAYRLAPEHPFPAAAEDALAAYEYLLREGFAPENISLVGESAGGGLCLALALSLKMKKRPMPGRIVAVSPWADLTKTAADYAALNCKDPILSGENLAEAAALYGGKDRENPLVSPVKGDYADFPPVLLYAGDQEILLDDSLAVYKAMEQAKSPCTLKVAPGMWHVYVLYGVPEAKAAMAEITGFLQGEPQVPGCVFLENLAK